MKQKKIASSANLIHHIWKKHYVWKNETNTTQTQNLSILGVRNIKKCRKYQLKIQIYEEKKNKILDFFVRLKMAENK